MLNWDDLKFCLAIDRHGSMLNASKSLKANVATVSRRLDRITKEFGETLFIRNGHDWQATAAGVELVQIAKDVEGRLSALMATDHNVLPEDAVIKLSVSLTIMQTFIKRLTSYRNGDKIVQNIDLTIHDRSLAYSEADISVRYSRPENGNYICAKVAEVEICPYISSTASTFPTHWIEVDYDDYTFRPDDFGFPMPAIPKLKIEGLNITADAIRQQNFLAFLPIEFAKRVPGIKPASANVESETLEVWMVYHQTRKLDPIVRAGVEIIQASLSADPQDEAA